MVPMPRNLLRVARRYITGVLCPHARSEGLLHSAFSRLAVRKDDNDPAFAYLRSCSLSVLLVVADATAAAAQTPETPPAETTMFPHPDDSRWWLSGQVNLISQAHGRFTSPYQGDNSLRPDPEQALSRLWTIYTGVKLPGHTELLFDIESAGGRGLSDALGLAGFTNLDVVRNPTLGSAPYIARAMVHVTVPLSQRDGRRARRPPSRWRHMSPRAGSRSVPASWGWRTSSTSTRSAATAISSSRTGPSTTTARTTTRPTRAGTPTPPSWSTTRRNGRCASARR